MTPRLAAMYALDEVAMRSWHHDVMLAPTRPMSGRGIILDANNRLMRTPECTPNALRRAAFEAAYMARLALKLRRQAALDTIRLEPGKREDEIAVTEYYAIWCAKAWARCMELAASCKEDA